MDQAESQIGQGKQVDIQTDQDRWIRQIKIDGSDRSRQMNWL